MATLFDLFDHIRKTGECFSHAEYELLAWWDHTCSACVIYCLPSYSWCFASTREEAIQMLASWRVLDPGWSLVERCVSLPAPGETARCESCRWLFWKRKGYHEPGEYAYCADCCSW